MTTAGAPKTPETPYDVEIEQMRTVQTPFDMRPTSVALENQRIGWLARDADHAPLLRQMVEALETTLELIRIGKLRQTASEYEPQIHDLWTHLDNTLDAARKAGL